MERRKIITLTVKIEELPKWIRDSQKHQKIINDIEVLSITERDLNDEVEMLEDQIYNLQEDGE